MLDKIANKLLKYTQRQIDKAYEKEGLTDDVLDLQLRVNEIRAKHDIAEKDEFLQ